MIEIRIEGDPKPQGRPRFSRRGGVYYTKGDSEWRRQVRESARLAMKEKEPLTCELKAAIKLYRRYRPTARNYGDLDNHAKAILDALQGVAFADDKQVTSLTISKHTDKETPRVEVTIEAAQE